MNRTTDGRFASQRIKLTASVCNKLFLNIKKENDWTWREFAKHLGVSEHTVRYDWRHANATLPKPIFNKLQRLSKKSLHFNPKFLSQWWGQRIGSKSKVQIKLPTKTSKEFAEFYGAMLGDGCLYKNMKSICITCNSCLDNWYVENYLAKLCFSLFGIRPKIYYSKKGKIIRLVVNNKKITKFFSKLGFPRGRKKQHRLTIPSNFFKDNKLLAACLRGLVDTDGGIYAHPHTKIMLDATSLIPSLLMAIHNALNQIKIEHGITRNRVQIYGSKKINCYLTVIGCSNPRNLIKLLHFSQTGRVPSTTETERLLKYNKKFDVPYHGPVV